MKVSVILPTYQSEQFVLATLESIREQTYSIDQLIISDDGSTDSTNDIIKHFSTQCDFEVKHVEGPCEGVTANYLNALAHASGEVIVMTDHDDIWLENRIEKIVDAFADPKVSLASHDSLLVDENLNTLGTTIRGGPRASANLSNSINSASEQNNYQLFLRGGLPLLAHTLAFRGTFKDAIMEKPAHIDDWWFEEWVSCVCTRVGRLYFIQDALLLYRQHATQTSGGFNSTNTKQQKDTMTGSKYQSRIDKLSYCLDYPSSVNGRDSRAPLLREYIRFLQRRAELTETPKFRSLKQAINLVLSGDYKTHAQGIKSFAADLVSLVNRRNLRNK